MSQRFMNKTVIVTGGGGGIGRALCEGFAREGAFVVAADLDIDAAEETVKALPDCSGSAAHLDVTDPDSWAALKDTVCKARDTIDILCNNAGVMLTGPVDAAPLAHWELQSRVNVSGVFLGCKTFLPLIRSSGGSILNTASLAGLHPWPDAALYAASKYAVVGLSETLRLEAGDDVHIAVLAPGGIDTAMTAKLENDDNERLIPPYEVADVVLDAMAERRDWVFTHPEYMDFLHARHAAIVADYQKIC